MLPVDGAPGKAAEVVTVSAKPSQGERARLNEVQRSSGGNGAGLRINQLHDGPPTPPRWVDVHVHAPKPHREPAVRTERPAVRKRAMAHCHDEPNHALSAPSELDHGIRR